MEKSLNILFISNFPPTHSAGLANDYMRALKLAGHHVDYLTKYDYPGRKENEYYVLKEKKWIKLRRWCMTLPLLYNFIHRFHLGSRYYTKESIKVLNRDNGLMITNMYEDQPSVEVSLVLNAIKKKYDVVLTLFWQEFITSVTLKAIYDKLNCPIIIRSVDMFTYTGGCNHFGECKNYLNECGKCPVLNSTDTKDQTHRNFMIKKKAYASMNYAIGLNSWMQQFAKPTGLFEEDRIVTTSASIDENLFIPKDKAECKRHFGINEHKFVLFSRAAGKGNVAKGFDYLLKAVNSFADSLDERQRRNVVLALAGRELNQEEKSDFKVEVVNLGMLSREDLIVAYNAGAAFLSPSIDDAGPSMVNQSIMCGTPVVCFDIGTAWDVIENGKSGYKVKLKDEKAFGHAIGTIFAMNEEEYSKLRNSTREIALKFNSLKAFSDMVENTYEKLLKMS